MNAPPRLRTLFLLFLRIGCTAFGMGILQSLRETLLRRGIVTEQELAEGLALVQLYPGPMTADLTAYIGYLRRGTAGALVSFLGFVTPATLMMLGLAMLYHHFGARPGVAQGLLGLDAVMAGVMAHITLDFSAHQLKRSPEWLLAIGCGALAIAGLNLSLMILAGIGLGAWQGRHAPSPDAAPAVLHWRRFRPALWLSAGLALGFVWAWLRPSTGGDLYLAFMHIGAVAFGKGLTILPMLREVVLAHGWLTPSDLSTGIAFSQITPGPVLNAATFAGYMAAGWPGGLLATFSIFAPSIVMTLIFAELFARIRHLAWIKSAIHGAMIAFCGMIASVAWFMAVDGIHGINDAIAALAVWLALGRFKLSLPLAMSGGVLLWLLLRSIV